MTEVWETGCQRVASGEIYSTCVVIVVVLGILLSFFLVVLFLVGVFGLLLSGAMRAQPLSAEAEMRSDVEL